MAIPQALKDIITRFSLHYDSYKQPQYNETQLRQEFLDSFFECLGWDVNNNSGKSESYKDVVLETRVRVQGKTKNPDYAFRIGGRPVFFVEAKKPAVFIKNEILPALQVRRYGWSAKLPISILTDFEEFSIYDTSIKPKNNDNAGVARIFYCRFDEYEKHWNSYIYPLIAKENIEKGSVEYFSNSDKKQGTSPVDEEFLKDIEGWREMLASNLAKNNKLNEDEINFATQIIIDRILFLRIAEARQIENEGHLQSIAKSTKDLYATLIKHFQNADDKYNSGLFNFQNDVITKDLKIDPLTLEGIIKRLYYPAPYEFSIMPSDILGSVYERFLGKVIRFTSHHRIKIEEKPDVKKAGGVYYTPIFIVKYIVENTLGVLCEGASQEFVKGIKICDPACGSGSFLLEAYSYLLQWHEEKLKNKLSIDKKKEILINNIFGVDIDPQAVEVTKLSLLLKALEGENESSIADHSSFFKQKALPDLDKNIQSGNSLIANDIYSSLLDSLLPEKRKINAFDWEKGFKDIFVNGGFDVVIGNPPWGADIDDYLEYFSNYYSRSTKSHKDSFKLFIEKGLGILKPEGLLGYIVPSSFMFQSRYVDIRRHLRDDSQINKLWNVGDKVFGPKVVAPSAVVIAEKKNPDDNHEVLMLDTSLIKNNNERIKKIQSIDYQTIKQKLFKETIEENFVSFYRPLKSNEIFLEDVVDCQDCGIKHQRKGTGLEDKGNSDMPLRIYYEGKMQDKKDYQFIIGKNINATGWNVIISDKRYLRHNYKNFLKKNESVYFNENTLNLDEKIIWRQTSDRIRAAIIGKFYFANTIQCGVVKDKKYNAKYVLGLMNSKFLNYIYMETLKTTGRVFPQVTLGKVKKLPFRTIDFSNPAEKSQHDKMVSLVENIMALYENKVTMRTPIEQKQFERQLESLTSDINHLVYELYNLTPDQIITIEATYK